MEVVEYRNIKVDRVVSLEQLKPADAEKFFQLIEENRDYLAELLPSTLQIKKLQDAIDFIQAQISAQKMGDVCSYGIKNQGKLVGYISLENLRSSVSPDIIYWVVQRYRKRGIATRAARAITDLALNKLFLPRVLIKADQRGVAANRIAQKLGYSLSDTISEAGSKLNVWEIVQ